MDIENVDIDELLGQADFITISANALNKKKGVQIINCARSGLVDELALAAALNTASVLTEDAPILRPYIGLVASLGSFLGQVESTRLKFVVIEPDGRAAKLNGDPIVASTLVGLLGPAMESVNMVNAAAVASGYGIAVSTIRHDRQCDYETLIRVTINHNEGERTVAGTLVGGNKPRTIEMQSIAVEPDFLENLLYLRNYDKPDLLGIWVRYSDGMA